MSISRFAPSGASQKRSVNFAAVLFCLWSLNIGPPRVCVVSTTSVSPFQRPVE